MIFKVLEVEMECRDALRRGYLLPILHNMNDVERKIRPFILDQNTNHPPLS